MVSATAYPRIRTLQESTFEVAGYSAVTPKMNLLIEEISKSNEETCTADPSDIDPVASEKEGSKKRKRSVLAQNNQQPRQKKKQKNPVSPTKEAKQQQRQAKNKKKICKFKPQKRQQQSTFNTK